MALLSEVTHLTHGMRVKGNLSGKGKVTFWWPILDKGDEEYYGGRIGDTIIEIIWDDEKGPYLYIQRTSTDIEIIE